MASGAVRELITKIKFQIDKASESKAKSTMQELKRQLNNFAKNPTKAKIGIDTTRATTALQGIKTQLNSLQGKTVTTYVQTKQKGASASAIAKGGKGAGSQFGNDFAGALGVGTVSAGMVAGAGVAAAGAAAGVAVKKFADFDATMSKVRALTNATDTDMQKLTQTAQELGAKTKFSATESAEAMTYLGMAGWKTEQIISAMPGLLDLAAASGEDLARVADIVSDDLTAFKMPAEQAGHMADVMAAASTNANTNVSMMGETFKYAGAVAGALGYSLEDVAAATGLMANSGIKAEMAGTALRSIMTRLVTPPKEAGSAMDRLGISVQNADGTLKPFRQQMIELRKAFAELSEAERSEAAKAIAGQEAMAGFLAVVNASEEDFNKMTAAVDNADGAAAKMAKTMNDNLKGSLTELGSVAESVALKFGKVLEPAVRGAVNGIKAALSDLSGSMEDTQKILDGGFGRVNQEKESKEATKKVSVLENKVITKQSPESLHELADLRKKTEELGNARKRLIELGKKPVGEQDAKALEEAKKKVEELEAASKKLSEIERKALGEEDAKALEQARKKLEEIKKSRKSLAELEQKHPLITKMRNLSQQVDLQLKIKNGEILQDEERTLLYNIKLGNSEAINDWADTITNFLAGAGEYVTALENLFSRLGNEIEWVGKLFTQDLFGEWELCSDLMRESIDALGRAYQNLAPFIEAITPLLQVIVDIVGFILVWAFKTVMLIGATAFRVIAGVIEAASEVCRDFGNAVKWVANELEYLIGLAMKAFEWLGLIENKSAGLNATAVNSMFGGRLKGGDTNTVTQNNSFTFTNPNQYAPVAQNLGNGLISQFE